MNKPTFEIDGFAFETLDGIFEEVSRKLVPNQNWGRNLDAFNDILRGGFGTPESGFVLRWKNSQLSQQRLGYAETIRVLRRRLTTCHPANIPSVQADLDAAQRGEGTTIFQVLVEIIRNHGAGGDEAEDGVELILD